MEEDFEIVGGLIRQGEDYFGDCIECGKRIMNAEGRNWMCRDCYAKFCDCVFLGKC